jgi:hypothetical protein
MEVTNARVFTCLPLQNGVDFFSGSTPLDDLCVGHPFSLDECSLFLCCSWRMC